MKVSVPEPVDPVSLYKFVREMECTQKDLETILRVARLELDKICANTLQGNRYTVVAYEMAIERRDLEERLCFPVVGEFDLSVKAGKEYDLPRFQNRYHKAFQEAVANIGMEKVPISVRIDVAGFRDKITKHVEAREQ